MDISPPPPPPPPPKSNYKPDRKIIEKNRRNQMKFLFSELDSLIASSSSPSFSGQQLPDRLDDATNYIKKMQERIEQLKEKKRKLISSPESIKNRRRSPQIEVHDLGSGLNAVLIISSGDQNRDIMHKSVRAVEEGGAEVLNAHCSFMEDKSIISLHTLVRDAKESGTVTGTMLNRLKEVF